MDTTSSLSSLPSKPWSLAIGRFSGGYCRATLQWPALVRQVTAVVSWVALGALVGHGGALHGRDSGMALTAMCSHGWMALLDLHLEGVASGGGAVHHIQSQATEMAPQKEITERGEVQVNLSLFYYLTSFPMTLVFFSWGMELEKQDPQAHARTVAVLCLQWFGSGMGPWELGCIRMGLTGCSQP